VYVAVRFNVSTTLTSPHATHPSGHTHLFRHPYGIIQPAVKGSTLFRQLLVLYNQE
jgi:hypothetical protein